MVPMAIYLGLQKKHITRLILNWKLEFGYSEYGANYYR